MIKRVNKIKKFGKFEDFKWGSNKDFSKYNLFYGWNYSGKTTLSRIFQCFQFSTRNINYPDAEFELEDSNNAKHNEIDIDKLKNIKVFNSDFINKNLKWYKESEDLEPILLIGEENIALKDKLTVINKTNTKLNTDYIKISEDIKKSKNDLEQSLSDLGRDIKNYLDIINYDKDKVKKEIHEISLEYKSYILPNFKEVLNKFKNKEKREIINKLEIKKLDLKKFIDECNSAIEKQITSKEVIQNLIDNPKANVWVKEGLEINQDKEFCYFCGNKIPVDLFLRLDNHFSKEYDDASRYILALQIKCESFKMTIENLFVSIPDKSRLYKEYHCDYEKNEASILDAKNKFILFLKDVNTKIGHKKNNLFNKSTEVIEYINYDEQLELLYQKLNEIIDSNNQITINFNTENEVNKQKLVKHYISTYLKNKNYYKNIRKIIIKEYKNSLLSKEISENSEEILKIEKQLSQAIKGAEKINENIKKLVNHDEIYIEVEKKDGNEKFVIKRSDGIAKNLSEGEKTIISLSYFFAELCKTEEPKEEIIFIDDPISSLDYNHLFSIYSFMKDNITNFKQVFISTHNLDFFNLFKDWMIDKNIKHRKDERIKNIKESDIIDESNFYLVKRIKNKSIDQSGIYKMPSLLLKFKSEYQYLFHLIYDFSKETKSDSTKEYEQLYIIPNIVRRFLEAYLSFKIPTQEQLDQKIEKIIKDVVMSNKIYKLINTYSHDASCDKVLSFPDQNECIEVVNIILDNIEENDNNHFESLKKISEKLD